MTNEIKDQKEILDTLNELSKKPIIELAMSYMEVIVDNIVKDKEIARLNKIIDELEKWLEEQHQFIIEIPAYTKEISIEHKTMELCYENILDKLQELKENKYE